MIPYRFIQTKKLNIELFAKYIDTANKTNQFSNNGEAVKQLEERASKMLEIDSSKAVIAANNGTSALHAIIQTLKKVEKVKTFATQAFNFPSAIQGPLSDATIVDIDSSFDINLEDARHADVIIPTNCFGHLQNLDSILSTNKIVVFDNAATPYSFWKNTNSLNLGTASFVSLHHTKPIGFGEGGLIIINKYYEPFVRKIIEFDKQEDGTFTPLGNNYKMSEIAAASILQWWDQFDINSLRNTYLTRYNELLNKLPVSAKEFPHKAAQNEIFFPNCLPVLYYKNNNAEIRKYYKPLSNAVVANYVYNNISCLPLAD